MNLLLTATNILITFILLPECVVGDRVIRFLLNNGDELPDGQTCDDTDLTLIDEIFNPPVRRNLRSGRTSSEAERALGFTPSYCKQNCAGFKSGYCLATNCKRYRRNDRLLENDADDRSLATCSEAITEIHQQLDDLISTDSVSPDCVELLSAPRNATCYDDVVFGEVTGFTFWKNLGNDDEVIVTNAANGTTICKSISVNIEVVVNTCVDVVKFVLTGPNQYYYTQNEYAVPYTLFGDYNNNYNGRTLNVGSYTLVVLPDKIASKRKTLKFQIANC